VLLAAAPRRAAHDAKRLRVAGVLPRADMAAGCGGGAGVRASVSREGAPTVHLSTSGCAWEVGAVGRRQPSAVQCSAAAVQPQRQRTVFHACCGRGAELGTAAGVVHQAAAGAF
jgi:hypothetical protein